MLQNRTAYKSSFSPWEKVAPQRRMRASGRSPPHLPQRRPCLRILRINLQHLLKLIAGTPRVSCLIVEQAKIDVSRNESGDHIDHSFIFLDRFIFSIQGLQRYCQIVMSIGEEIIDDNRLPVRDDGLIQFSLCDECGAQIGVCLLVAAIESDGFLKFRARLAVFFLGKKHKPQPEVCFFAVLVNCKRPVIGRQRLRKVTLFAIDRPQVAAPCEN